MAPVAFVIWAQSRFAMACPSKELTQHESKWYRRKPTLQSFHYDMLVSSNRASYGRLLALEHINAMPAYFFISCERNHLSEHLTCMDSSKSSRRLSCKSRRYAIYMLLSGDHRVGRPQGSLAVDPTYNQQKGKQWRKQKFGWNLVLHLFAVRLANKTCPENPVKYQ